MENVTITFNGLTADEAANLLAAIRHDYIGPKAVVESATIAVETTTAAETAKPRRGHKPRAATEAAAAPADATPPSHDLPLPEPRASIEDVRKALSDLLAAKGMPACSQLLAEFKAHRIGELPIEKYAAVVAACRGAQA